MTVPRKVGPEKFQRLELAATNAIASLCSLISSRRIYTQTPSDRSRRWKRTSGSKARTDSRF